MSETKTPYKIRGPQHGGSRPVIRPDDGRTVKRLVETKQLVTIDASREEKARIFAAIPDTRERTLIWLEWIEKNESKEQSQWY